MTYKLSGRTRNYERFYYFYRPFSKGMFGSIHYEIKMCFPDPQLSAYAATIVVHRNIITTLCVITFQCTGVSCSLPGCQNRRVRSFNSMQGVTNPRCAIRRQNTGHAERGGKKQDRLMHAVISRSYPKPSVPVSWQIINVIIIHLLGGRNPQTSREFRLCTSTSHPCHFRRCSRFLVVIPKQSEVSLQRAWPGVIRAVDCQQSGVSPERLAYRRLTTDRLSLCEPFPRAGKRSWDCRAVVLQALVEPEVNYMTAAGQHTGFELEKQPKPVWVKAC